MRGFHQHEKVSRFALSLAGAHASIEWSLSSKAKSDSLRLFLSSRVYYNRQNRSHNDKSAGPRLIRCLLRTEPDRKIFSCKLVLGWLQFSHLGSRRDGLRALGPAGQRNALYARSRMRRSIRCCRPLYRESADRLQRTQSFDGVTLAHGAASFAFGGVSRRLSPVRQ